MKKILIIVPTRNRNVKTQEFATEFFKNSTISDLVYGLDDDDQQNYDRLDNVIYEINPRLRLNGTLNLIANKYANKYEYIGFMGDDHRTRTYNWDGIMYEKMKTISNVIAYGNDLYQGEKLPTSVIMDSNIIKKLGYMSPPSFTHLYLDNFWKEIGTRLNTLTYFPNVVIEHMHFVLGKADKDELYSEVNSKEMNKKDKSAFEMYVANNLENDLRKLL